MPSDPRLSAVAAARAATQAQPAALAARQYRPSTVGQSRFDALLDVRFSNHAQRRLVRREISLASSDLQRLTRAVDRAKRKGARDSLILMDNVAYVVDVQRRLVVTAVDAANQKEGVFTNIDSVVLAD